MNMSDVPDVRLAHVGLTVSDIERSLTFWKEGLGLELIVRQEKRGGYMETVTGVPDAHVLQAHLQFPGATTRVELLQYLEPEGLSITVHPPVVGTGHVAIRCSDLDATLTRLVEHGGRPFSEPVLIDTGANKGCRAVYVGDPDGHIAELVQLPA
jgi:catechol 2,3-dioxygenase-like lactoylglutathione lyase family enzyme